MIEYEMTLQQEIHYLRFMAERHAREAVELCERVASGRDCLEDQILLDGDAAQYLAWAEQASELADRYEQQARDELKQWLRECIVIGLQPTAAECGASVH